MMLSKLYSAGDWKELISIGLIVGLVLGLLAALVWQYDFLPDFISYSGDLARLTTLGVTVGIIGIVILIIVGLITRGLGFGFLIGCITGFSFLSSILSGWGLVTIIPFWILFIISVVIIEVLFWLDKEKSPKGEEILFTIMKKLECIGDIIIGFGIVNYIIHLVSAFTDNVEPASIVLKWVGIVVLVILGIIGYVMLNSLKYRGKK